MTTAADDTPKLEPFVVPLDPKEELLRSIVEPVLEQEGFQLVHLALLVGGRRSILRLYVDTKGGDGAISLPDLERLNHLLGDVLDVEDEHRGIFRGGYNLEVSSPGLDRPLAKKSHFLAAQGKKVKVKTRAKLNNARSFTGPLSDVDDAGISVDGTKIGWRDVSEAHAVFEFAEKSAPKPKRHKRKG